MFSVTVVMAQSYNFSLMTENVKNTSYVRKNGDSAYAGVNVTSLSYPSATIKFKAYKQGKGFVSNYNSVRGIGVHRLYIHLLYIRMIGLSYMDIIHLLMVA